MKTWGKMVKNLKNVLNIRLLRCSRTKTKKISEEEKTKSKYSKETQISPQSSNSRDLFTFSETKSFPFDTKPKIRNQGKESIPESKEPNILNEEIEKLEEISSETTNEINEEYISEEDYLNFLFSKLFSPKQVLTAYP
jgi:hypothetical protein